MKTNFRFFFQTKHFKNRTSNCRPLDSSVLQDILPLPLPLPKYDLQTMQNYLTTLRQLCYGLPPFPMPGFRPPLPQTMFVFIN